MVVVVDGHADVVQHARRPQQFALDPLAIVQSEARELVEHRQGERGDMVGVGRVGSILRGQVQHARATDVGEQRRVAVGRTGRHSLREHPRTGRTGQQALEEDALAQPRLGDFEAVEATGDERSLHDDRPGEDQVRAHGLDSGHRASLRRGQRGQPLDEVLQRVAGDDHRLHAVGRQPFRPLHCGGEVADRPADAHQARAGAGQPLRLLQFACDALSQLVDLLALRGTVRGQEPLGHAHRAQAPRAELVREPVDDAHQLQRSPAEIQHAAVGQGRRVDRREIPVARLLLAAEHADRQARVLAGQRHEALGVLGVPDRAGGDRVHLLVIQIARAAEVVEHVQRRQRTTHRLLPQPAARRQPLTDAHRLVDLIGTPPPTAGRHEHDEPERVRAEIDHGQALSRLRSSLLRHALSVFAAPEGSGP